VKKLEEALGAYESRLKTLEGAAAPAADTNASNAAPAASLKPATAAPKTGGATKTPAVAKVDPDRKAAIAAVEIPATGDAIEDAYTYGFRLWSAKLYPEAQMKLKEFVAKYPTHKRASYAQNLLGRAYLDEGKPALASVAFYDNYQKMPRGERASESLYWLGVALTKLKKPADACKVYKEFDDVYADKASADLKAKVAKGKTDAKCAA
jgi:TolA-binding protein